MPWRRVRLPKALASAWAGTAGTITAPATAPTTSSRLVFTKVLPSFHTPTELADGLARKVRATPLTRRLAPEPVVGRPQWVPRFPPTARSAGNSALCPPIERRALYRTGAALASTAMSELDVSVDDVAERHREGAVQLIDVREDHEWDAGRIAGARHVTLGAVAAEAATIDRETPVVFYCRVGGRSTMA